MPDLTHGLVQTLFRSIKCDLSGYVLSREKTVRCSEPSLNEVSDGSLAAS